jgi:hypothetical protein
MSQSYRASYIFIVSFFSALGGFANTFYFYPVVCDAGTLFILTRIKETRGIVPDKMDSVFKH